MTAKKIMIIDDEIDLTKLLQIELSAEGFEVFIANDGKSGLARIKEIHPDLVLLDIMMPGMNGYEVLTNIKADPDIRNIPVLMVTARGLAEEVQKGIDLGAIDYIPKPFHGALLVNTVKKIIENGKKQEGCLPETNSPLDQRCASACNILIIEDTSTARKMFAGTLEKAGYNIFLAKDGEEGLEKVAEVQPDLILLDIHMPHMDGFQVLSTLKGNPATEDIPVIIATASGLDTTVQDMIDLGASDYMIKPIPMMLLLKKIEVILGSK